MPARGASAAGRREGQSVSSAGAVVGMQLLPETWQWVATVVLGESTPRTYAGNVRAGVAYLSHLLHDFDGNTRLALAAWYQGEGAVRQRGIFKVTSRFVADVLALEQRM